MEDIKDRLKKALEYRNMKPIELSEKTKIPKSAISQYMSGYAKPKQDRIDIISEALNISPAWLLGYDTNISKDTNPTSDKKGVRINVVGSVPAGVPVEAITDIIDWEEIPQEWTRGGKEYIGLKVKGDSMYPKYVENDTIIVLITPDCDSGQDCVVFVNRYDATLKKVRKNENGTITLIPFNREYPEKTYGKGAINEEITIFGKVVEIRRKP